MTKSSRITMALAVLVAVAMVGTAVASNMAFKVNKQLLQGTTRNPAGTALCGTCGNWVSLPDTGEFNGLRLFDICARNPAFQIVAQTGLCEGSGSTGGTIVKDATLVNAVGCIRTCGGLPGIASNPPYQPHTGIKVVLCGTVAGLSTCATRPSVGDISHVFVGAHAPGTQYLIRQSNLRGGTGSCASCGNTVNLPYHTTAARLQDVCAENLSFRQVAQSGLQLADALGRFGLFTTVDETRIDAIACIRTCGGLPSIGPNCPVQIGKPVNIALKDAVVGDVLWSPAHF